MKERNDFEYRNETEYVNFLVERYSKMLFRICFVVLGNEADAEDAVQETFLRFLTKSPDFSDAEHEKAWFIRVATNISKNMIRFRINHDFVDIDEMRNVGIADSDLGLFESIMRLPVKNKIAMDLYYIEGYRIKEISNIVGATPEAVRKRLQKGRTMLKNQIEDSGDFRE